MLAMLNSCASNVSVVNIDNGFGAAYSAWLVWKQVEKATAKGSTQKVENAWISAHIDCGSTGGFARAPQDGNKGTFGRLLIVGGNEEMISAPVLAGMAALRIGAGLVQVALPDAVLAAALRFVLS